MAVGRVVLIGMVAAAVPEALNTFVDSFSLGPWGTAAAGIVGGGLTALVDGLKEPPPRRPGGPGPAQPRWTSVLVAFVVVGLLGAAAYGGSELWRYWAGTESGVERMAQPPAKGTAGTLTATVRGVEVTPHFIKVKLVTTNSGQDPITIAVNDQWCRLVGGDGTALPPYGGITGLGDGNIEVPGGSILVTTVLTFKGSPPGNTLALSFSALFGALSARSLLIKNIKLTG